MNHPSKELMLKAIELARSGHGPASHDVGCIIVKGDEVLAEAVTSVNQDKDSTAHAEMLAIKSNKKVLHFVGKHDPNKAAREKAKVLAKALSVSRSKLSVIGIRRARKSQVVQEGVKSDGGEEEVS